MTKVVGREEEKRTRENEKKREGGEGEGREKEEDVGRILPSIGSLFLFGGVSLPLQAKQNTRT